MTTITIPRALLEQALEALEIVTDDYDDSAVGLEVDAIQALRAELAKSSMEQADNGGPAFPLQTWDAAIQSPKTETGLTLRDYFAAKVMPSVYSSAMVEASQGSGLFSDPNWREGLARDAYMMADAMLKARKA